ncbi:hypothetical protein F9B85_10970 [Heliorestis acidaminivorans]|uniref:Serine aminopeptidase S33 domain-containing protein n=1 Tax=Heliorestis acidaminivorans TaxID=553427 RepID=A0A6I0F0H4_9FIRM|nr:alpha/beta hydrolase [Heliorestis acidaminivorans]KAB2951805.1 hypothetical protein F9B85_10970 [Heliorestis acidaminivorans]
MKKIVVISLVMLLALASLIYWERPYLGNEPINEREWNVERVIADQETIANVYIVFLNGLGCYSDGSRFNNMGFHEIRKALTKVGYNLYDDRFLQYSYLGGEIRKGIWHPRKYSPRDTGQPMQVSVQALESMIEEFTLLHEEAQFLLVGHSLGGRIALDFVSRTNHENRERIKGVVTLNSPLLGSSARLPEPLMRLLEYSGHVFSAPVVKQLIWEYSASPDFIDTKRQMIEALQEEGLRVATFSAESDLIVPAFTSFIVDEQGKPIADGKVIEGGRLFHRDLSGHMFILSRQEVQQYILSLLTERESIVATEPQS